ncbi:MAG: toxin-antitoxin system YwqK family antitoxin [Planctomycetota bacterium]|jgi:hypothetical protein
MNGHKPVRQVIRVIVLCLSGGCAPGPRNDPLSRPAAKVEIVEERWPDGTLMLRREVLRKPDGALVDHGRYTRWYNNGQKEYEGTFIRGRNDGVATRWHRNGQKAIEEHYARGQRHGTRSSWDENGVKRKEEHHFEDKPDGVWTVWDEHGRLKWQGRFDRGIPK